jgi:DNA-binding response OmpR family regulator
VTYLRVRTIIGEPDPDLRSLMRRALESLGLGAIQDAPSLAKAHQLMRREGAELLLLNMSAEENDASGLVEQIRFGRLAGDPFPVIIALLAQAAAEQVKRVACSGVDDALIIPFSTDVLTAKIAALSDGRKPFIVTFDYIGPERRSAPRPGASSARQIAVPNPLAMLGSEGGAEGYEAARDRARLQLERERIVRLGAQLEWLSGALSAPDLSETDKAMALLNIEWVGKELIGRIGASTEAQKLGQLITQSQKIRKSDQAVPAAILEKFHQAMIFIVRSLPPLE